jgi:hypothetical protein
MGKADDLKLFDKVAAAPNLPAIRGDVVQMIDNSLTVKHLVQKGYGSTEYYEEGKEDFLYKLRIDEIDGDGDGLYVTAISRVNSRLDDDEIELENGDIYTLKTPDVKAEEIFGKKVKIWVKRDDNKKYKDVFYVKVETAEKDDLFDAIDEADIAKRELTLKIADKTYDIKDDKDGKAKIYINYEEMSFSELEAMKADDLEGLYGNFVLERGEIVFANLFDFDRNDIGLVTEVAKDYIEFVALEDAKEDEIDLTDYKAEDVHVYDKNFNVLDVDDIEKDSLVYFWENDDDEIFIVVAGEVLEGEIDRVRDAKVRIDGKSYDKGASAILSYDKGKNYDTWDNVKDVEDLTEEKVWALLGLDGTIAVIRGEAVETSGTIYGIATYASVDKTGTLSLFNKDGKVVDYTAESRSMLDPIEHDKGNLNYYGTNENLGYSIVAFRVNRDGEISDDKENGKYVDFNYVKVKNETATKGTDFEEIVDINVDVKVDKEDDKAFFTAVNAAGASTKYYVSKDTIIMSAKKDGELDPSVITYDNFVSMSIDKSKDKSKAVVFGEPGKNAKLVVFLEDNFEGSKETFYFGVVTGDTWVGRKATTVEINVAGEGKTEYKIKDSDEDKFAKGSVVAFALNSKDEAKDIVSAAVYDGKSDPSGTNGDATIIAGTVADVDGSFIKVGAKSYKVASDAVIYDFKLDGKKFKLDGTIRMSRISEDDYVILMFDEDSKEVKAAAVYYAKDLEKFNK